MSGSMLPGTRIAPGRSGAGPCERQWGTVLEGYSEAGNAWDYISQHQARSRAYRWGEEGLAGISDDQIRLCFAVALWNGKDPILKERLFGLTNSEGNHGEDVKKYYFYLDSTPTHSYMKYLYKCPWAAFAYSDFEETNRCRSQATTTPAWAPVSGPAGRAWSRVAWTSSPLRRPSRGYTSAKWPRSRSGQP
jgi:hypothetical protein